MGILANISTNPTAADVWKYIKQQAVFIKNQANGLNSASAAGNMHAGTILNFTTQLADVRVQFAAAVALANLTTTARDDMNDNAIDAVAYVNSLISAIDAVTTWTAGAFPVSGAYNLIVTALANGRYQWREFTPAQTAGFRTQLTALAAAV